MNTSALLVGLLVLLVSGIESHQQNMNDFTTPLRTIRLSENNFVVIRGEINAISASATLHELAQFRDRDELYVFLDTPGGSVRSGVEIASFLKTLRNNGVKVSCIANNAMSMGFVIMQECPNRYVMESSIMMQHQMSFGVKGAQRQVEEYIKFIDNMSNHLDRMQSKRMGISLEHFREKTEHDWWLFSEQIVEENAADEIVGVLCDFSPKERTETLFTMFGPVKVTWSSCPLSSAPIAVEFIDNKNNATYFDVQRMFNPIHNNKGRGFVFDDVYAF